MTRRADRADLPRWLLFVLLTFGVAGMHTFGHAHQHAAVDPAGSMAHTTVSTQVAAGSMAHTTVSTQVAAGSMAHAAAGSTLVEPAGGPTGTPTGFTVCLAVLGALGLMIFTVALACRRSRGAGRRPRTVSRIPARGRAPPAGWLGLRMARAAVLRT